MDCLYIYYPIFLYLHFRPCKWSADPFYITLEITVWPTTLNKFHFLIFFSQRICIDDPLQLRGNLGLTFNIYSLSSFLPLSLFQPYSFLSSFVIM